MLSSILSIISGLFQALGWIKQKSDQDTGARLQQNADLTATVQEATDAAKITDTVAGMSDDQLNDRLRVSSTSH